MTPLRAQVAEKIMGWKPWRSKHGYFQVEIPGQENRSSFGEYNYSANYDPQTGKKLPEPQWWEHISVDAFDYDMCHAMSVVDTLWEQGWEFQLERRLDGAEWTATFNDRSIKAQAHGLTAPLAICLAALQTVSP